MSFLNIRAHRAHSASKNKKNDFPLHIPQKNKADAYCP